MGENTKIVICGLIAAYILYLSILAMLSVLNWGLKVSIRREERKKSKRYPRAY